MGLKLHQSAAWTLESLLRVCVSWVCQRISHKNGFLGPPFFPLVKCRIVRSSYFWFTGVRKQETYKDTFLSLKFLVTPVSVWNLPCFTLYGLMEICCDFQSARPISPHLLVMRFVL
jgi:hypothetical protein